MTLAAVAGATETLTLGTAVTPLPRRRPQVVAQQLSTLEALNGGRVVFGAGLGGNEKEFTAFGEDFDPHRRAKLLDDGLKIVRDNWPGPIWIGGNSAPALRRASRWDGWIANSVEVPGMTMTPDELARKVETIGRGAGFDVACNGYSSAGDAALCAAYADAGATWWLENLHDRRLAPDEVLARVAAGPARVRGSARPSARTDRRAALASEERTGSVSMVVATPGSSASSPTATPGRSTSTRASGAIVSTSGRLSLIGFAELS